MKFPSHINLKKPVLIVNTDPWLNGIISVVKKFLQALNQCTEILYTGFPPVLDIHENVWI